MTIRVLIVDDHAVVRQGLSMFLGLGPDFEIVGQAEDGIEAVELVSKLHPDVVLMDLIMPRMDGIRATAAIRAELPETEVLVLTSALEERLVLDAMRAGAIGYLLKTTDAQELRRAVRAAAEGQVQLCPDAAALLVKEFRNPTKEQEQLTERETEVLRLLAHGLSNKEMARRLGLTEATVKCHVKNLMGKLGVTSRTQAALHAIRSGVADLEVADVC